MGWTIKIHFTAGDETYDILRAGFNGGESVGASGKHATQTWPLSVNSQACYAKLFNETARLVKAEIYEGATVRHMGVIRPYQNISAHDITCGAVSLEIMDYTEVLHKRVASSTMTTNTNLKAAVQFLLALVPAFSGVAMTYATGLENIAVPYLPINEGEYVDEILSKLLNERGYDYVFRGSGCSVETTAYTGGTLPSVGVIRGALGVNRADNWVDGLKVSYKVAKTANMKIASGTVQIGDWSLIATSKISKRYYRKNGQWIGENGQIAGLSASDAFIEWEGAYVTEYENNNRSADHKVESTAIVSVANASPVISVPDERDAEISHLLTDVSATGCRFAVQTVARYNGKTTVNWEIWADVTYLVDSEATVDSASLEEPEEVSLVYCAAQADAQAYVQREYNRRKYAPTTFTWTATAPLTANGFYSLADSVTGISATVRVLSCKYSIPGLDKIYKITAEAAGNMGSTVNTSVNGYAVMTPTDSSVGIDAPSKTVGNADVAVSVVGEVATLSGYSFKWYVNGTDTTLTGMAVTIPQRFFSVGENNVRLDVIKNAQVFKTVQTIITKEYNSEKTQMYFDGTDANFFNIYHILEGLTDGWVRGRPFTFLSGDIKIGDRTYTCPGDGFQGVSFTYTAGLEYDYLTIRWPGDQGGETLVTPGGESLGADDWIHLSNWKAERTIFSGWPVDPHVTFLGDPEDQFFGSMSAREMHVSELLPDLETYDGGGGGVLGGHVGNVDHPFNTGHFQYLYIWKNGEWHQVTDEGGGGSSDYSTLTNKPKINGVELNGNKSLEALGIIGGEFDTEADIGQLVVMDGIDKVTNSDVKVSDLAPKSYVHNPTITFTQGGVTKGSFTLNQSGNQTIPLDAGGSGGETLTQFETNITIANTGASGSIMFGTSFSKWVISAFPYTCDTGDAYGRAWYVQPTVSNGILTGVSYFAKNHITKIHISILGVAV